MLAQLFASHQDADGERAHCKLPPSRRYRQCSVRSAAIFGLSSSDDGSGAHDFTDKDSTCSLVPLPGIPHPHT